MKCPVCNRNLAPTLSICLTCGAMMNDTVREELQTKVTPSANLPKPESTPGLAPPPKPVVMETRPKTPPAAKPVVTSGLNNPKTSPTLVEFQNKNTAIPDWRLQMQNAVRQRKGMASDDTGTVNAVTGGQTHLGTHGAAALKAEIVEQVEVIPSVENADPRLNAALRRIAESRKAFLPEEAETVAAKPPTSKSFPFNVVAPTPNHPVRPPRPIESAGVHPKPAMVSPLRMEKKLDTNKLPKIDSLVGQPAVEITNAPNPVEVEPAPLPLIAAQSEFSEVKRILINAENLEDIDDPEFESEDDGIEDLAPFSMRFNAGIFDVIIGVFASMVILSPFALAGGEWFSTAGILTFTATLAIVLFLYMTSSVGFFGKTLGMWLFSLELVDAEENEYPTLHQAAVSSSIYILSLILGGLGFITVFFNQEKRAAHDLLSGTIIVRQFT